MKFPLTETQQVYIDTYSGAERLLGPVSTLYEELRIKGENTDNVLRILHLLQDLSHESLFLGLPENLMEEV